MDTVFWLTYFWARPRAACNTASALRFCCCARSDALIPFMARCLLIAIVLLAALAAVAQEPDTPSANPGRPTVATPATLTPVGYLQFETGFLAAWHSPEFSSQPSLNEVMKFSVHNRIEFLLAD